MPARAPWSSAHGGRFPDDEAALLALPGIGAYTAAAIRAIAFDRPASAVDGNVERVIARLFAIETPLPDAKPEIQARAARLVPAAARRRLRPGDDGSRRHGVHAAQPALRDLPAMTTARPRKLGIAEELPRRAPKAEKPTRRGLAFVLARKDGAILLRKRPAKGLLGGMDEVPSSPWREGKLVDGRGAQARRRCRPTGRSSRAGAPHLHAFPSRAHRGARHRRRPSAWPGSRPARAGARSTA